MRRCCRSRRWSREARTLAAAGADVIDLGCLPETPFPLLGEAVRDAEGAKALPSASTPPDPDELRAGARAGADYLLSLDENTLPLAFEHGVTPVLIPSVPGDLDSLGRAIEAADESRHRLHRRSGARPDPFRLRRSLGRFIEARRRWPEVELLMGTGNLTELTDADSSGVTALLAGLCSELDIRNVLVVHVSPHTVRTIEEHDLARRILFAARARRRAAAQLSSRPAADPRPQAVSGLDRGHRGAGGRGARRRISAS